MQIDVDAQHAAAEVEHLVDAHVQLGEGVEPPGVVFRIVVVGPSLRIPRLDERRTLHVVGRVGRTAHGAQLRTEAPVARQVVGSADVDHETVVPRRGDPRGLPVVAVLRAEHGHRPHDVHSPRNLPAGHRLDAVGAPLRRGDQLLVAHHAVIVALARERNPVRHRQRHIAVAFVKSLDRDDQPVAQPPVDTRAEDPDAHVIERSVDQRVVLLESQRRVGRQLAVKSRAAAHRPAGTYRIGDRSPGRQLAPHPRHTSRVVAPVGAQARRGGEPLVGRGVFGPGEQPPADDSQPGPVVRQLRPVGIEPLQRAVRVVGIIHLDALADGPAAQIGAVLGPERGLLLHGAQPERQVVLRRIIVAQVFQVAVVQVVVAQGHGLHVAARIVTPRSPHREGLLPDTGQVAQQVFGVLPLLVDVETHVVESRKGQHRQLVALRKACLDFRLPVDVVGQEGQPQQFEQQLQVGLADGKQISRLAADVPAAAQPHFRGAQRRFEGLLFGIAVAEPEVQHGTQRPGPVGGKSARIKTDFAHEVGVDDAHRTARRPLRGEMVDVRDFDPVHVELVLRRPAAAHDQIVAIPHGREGHAGIRAHDARHVAVRAGAFLDLPQADHLQTYGTLRRDAERRRTDRHGLQLRGILLQLDFDKGRGGRDHVFGRREALVAHRRDRQPPDARLHALDAEPPQRVGRGSLLLLPGQHHGGIGHGAAAQTVDHPPADGIGPALRPHGKRRGQAEKQNSDFQEFHTAKILGQAPSDAVSSVHFGSSFRYESRTTFITRA